MFPADWAWKHKQVEKKNRKFSHDDVEVAGVADGASVAVPPNDGLWFRRVPGLAHDEV